MCAEAMQLIFYIETSAIPANIVYMHFQWGSGVARCGPIFIAQKNNLVCIRWRKLENNLIDD